MDQADNPISSVNPDVWVDEYGDYLFRYALSRLRDENAAEEVVQETFLAGVRFQDRYTGQGAERAWLLGILKRKIVDHVRRRTRYNRDGSYEGSNDPSDKMFDQNGNWKTGAFPTVTPAMEVESKEVWDVVKGCLEHLPQGQQDAFVLSVMEEMPSEEVCEALEITPANLWVRLHRARLGLAQCVGSRWLHDEEVPQHAK